MVLKLGLKPQATLFGGECSRLHMFPLPLTPLPLTPALLNPTYINAYYFSLFAKFWVKGGMELLTHNLYQFQLLCCMSTQ